MDRPNMRHDQTNRPLTPYEKYMANKRRDEERKNKPARETIWWRWLAGRDPIVRFTLYLAILAALQTLILYNQFSEMRVENRPWVGFELVSANNAKPGEKFSATFAVTNVGKSPALNVRAIFKIDFWDTKDVPTECYACSHFFLLPGAIVTYSPEISEKMTSNHDIATAPAILGRVDYEDSSGRRYWTTMCRYYDNIHFDLRGCLRGDDAGNE
jgi:hypothetical protein